MASNSVHRKLPKVVWNWLVTYKAWLVGSSVDWYLGGGESELPRDFDIMIPPESFQECCRMVDTPVTVNRFGGIKTTVDGIEIDFWPMHLESFFQTSYKDRANKLLRLHPFTLVVEDSRPNSVLQGAVESPGCPRCKRAEEFDKVLAASSLSEAARGLLRSIHDDVETNYRESIDTLQDQLKKAEESAVREIEANDLLVKQHQRELAELREKVSAMEELLTQESRDQLKAEWDRAAIPRPQEEK